jgi:hypothetical protein
LDNVLGPAHLEQFLYWAEDSTAPLIPNDSIHTLFLPKPHAQLSLTKTIAPITPPSSTHAFCIITAQPIRPTSDTGSSNYRSSLPDITHRGSNLSDPRNSYSTNMTSPSGFQSPNLDNEESYFPNPLKQARRQRSRPSRLPSDPEPAFSPTRIQTEATKYWDWLEQIDWASTSMGPRMYWGESLDPVISIVFQSSTADSVMIGRDMYQV